MFHVNPSDVAPIMEVWVVIGRVTWTQVGTDRL
jgi:hypothetical protein